MVGTEFHGETEHADRCAVTATVIDPRLWIATHLLAARVAAGEVVLGEIDGDYEREECQLCTHWADTLIAAHNATAYPKPAADEFTDIVFDGPPSHESGRLVEVKDHEGRSVSVGEWVESGDGYWRLRLRVSASHLTAARDAHNATAGEVAGG